MEKPEIAYTHAGRFHADDVFGTALLKEIWPDLKIRRVNEVPAEPAGLAFDIGGGEFDHHGPARKTRPNGIPYAAFGLLWREFGPGLVGEEQAEWLDQHFIQSLDKDDNTGCGEPLADAIGSFNPVWDSRDRVDLAFWQAEKFAAAVLHNKIENARAVNRAKIVVEDALAGMKHHICVLPVYAPWKNVLRDSDAELVVYPSARGGWSAQGVPIPDDPKHRLKVDFPESWWGLGGEELEKISGIPGLRFCHASGFLIAANTQEGAVAAAKKAREEARLKAAREAFAAANEAANPEEK